ncbi:MAG TPA: hypothetical protein VGE52_11215 [Pirellulales bacterium]
MNRFQISVRGMLLAFIVSAVALAGLVAEGPVVTGLVNTVILLSAGTAIAGAALGAGTTRAFCLGWATFLLAHSLAAGPLHPLVAWAAPGASRPMLLTDALVDRLCEWKAPLTVGAQVEAVDPSSPVAFPIYSPVGSAVFNSGTVPLGWQPGGNPSMTVWSGTDTTFDSFMVPYSSPVGGSGPPQLPLFSPGRIQAVKNSQYLIAWADGRMSWVAAGQVTRNLTAYREQARGVLTLVAAAIGGVLASVLFGARRADAPPCPSANAPANAGG